MNSPKKLIEVALPLEAINVASAREKSIRHGHPSTLHLWWARRPLAAARAVIFAQMVDDPSEYVQDLTSPGTESRKAAERELRKKRAALEAVAGKEEGAVVPTLEEVAADIERQRLFKIIEELVQWENTTNEDVLQQARDEIWQSWRRTCAQFAGHPDAAELFDRDKLPAFHDPFAGGGALPLEAQRLGLEAYASDLNPVAVLINKAMIVIPPKFAGMPPVNPGSRGQWLGNSDELSRTDGLAKSDATSGGGLSPGPGHSQGGDVRDAIPIDASGGFDSSERRGGLGQGVGQGEGAVSGHSTGVASGSGDSGDGLRAAGLVSSGQNASASWVAGRGREDADNASQTLSSTPGLNPASYSLFTNSYKGAQGLAEDVRYYGKWMRDEAEKRIGHLYPKVKVTPEMVTERPDLKPYEGKELTVIAWIWARTVKSPNPAYRDVDVPLASTFMLSTKAGKEAYVEPVIENGDYRFVVKVGKPENVQTVAAGTKVDGRGANFWCLMSGSPVAADYIKQEGTAGRIGTRLMAIVAEGVRGRVYLAPTLEHSAAAQTDRDASAPTESLPKESKGRTAFWCVLYGLTTWGDLFTSRQLTALTTFSDLVAEARERVRADAESAAHHNPQAYADAVGTYLAFGVDKCSDYWSSICTWHNSGEKMRNTFGRQAIPMTWDYTEANPFCESTGNWMAMVDWTWKALSTTPASIHGDAKPADAAIQRTTVGKLVSTDPPYYDNIGYADLSDFFYVWLRKSLRDVYPELFATIAVPKAEELVATPYRHGGKAAAEKFFLEGMTEAMRRLCEQAHPAFPVTIYYAFKQSETTDAGGQASTGWETFLEAVIRSGFALTGTWPMRTELGNRMIGSGTNALASSIVLVCRRREVEALTATRREFLSALERELPDAIADLQRGNVAPVDLQQASIGPGMAIFTRYEKVVDADGKPLSVRDALTMINQALDEVLSEQEGDFDGDTRWALAWFEQFGFAEGEYGTAEVLSKAKATSVQGVVDAGIAVSGKGKVRLLKPEELPETWTPEGDKRLTVWDMVHHLIRVLEKGEGQAGELMARLGTKAEVARELAYRLFSICDRTRRSQDALRYNALVQSWPEVVQLAQQTPIAQQYTQQSFEGMD